jgi:hypothetical protein
MRLYKLFLHKPRTLSRICARYHMKSHIKPHMKYFLWTLLIRRLYRLFFHKPSTLSCFSKISHEKPIQGAYEFFGFFFWWILGSMLLYKLFLYKPSTLSYVSVRYHMKAQSSRIWEVFMNFVNYAAVQVISSQT